ncbi:MAG: deoxyribose-phosphate aldolase [Nitrospiraceae bacterium]
MADFRSLDDFPSRIDHTVLRPESTRTDVWHLCEVAKRYGFRVVFVPPCSLNEAIAALAGTSIKVGIPIGFPLGWHTTGTKVSEAMEAQKHGATILDMVINISRLKSGDYDVVRTDIAEVVQATPSVEHKVILETCYLTRQEKITACRLAVEAGADYVKTSTGFGAGGATVEDVRLLREAVAGRIKVKASGGIRDLKTALAMLEAGADRIGTSASVTIMEEWLAQRMPRS